MKPESVALYADQDFIPVLVVDDEADIRDGCERILIRMGCKVFKADQGEAALSLLARERVAIALLDLKMPGMDGMDVLREIQAVDKEILTIVITGYATVETAIEAMKQGAYDFIPKPFEPDQLRIVVQRAQEKLRLRWDARKLEEERKKTLADLDMEKSRIRTIIEALPNGVVVTNVQGHVVFMNPAFLWHMGLDPSQMPGQHVGSYVADEGFCNLVTEISQGKRTSPEDMPAYEMALPNEKFILVRGRAVLGEDNECLGAVLIVVDITTMKVLERLKSEFVAKVSHELRSPLSTIHEQLALVLRDMGKDESNREQHVLIRAKEKTQGLISLIGDLLDLSRIEAGAICSEPRRVQVAALLKNIIDFLSARASARRQLLSLHITQDCNPYVNADPLALESIFGNLIANAINYTQDGGEIKIIVGLAGNMVRVDVQDNGFGMEERHLPKIFDKFYRVKDEKTRYITGTGLGLPIVKGLVEVLGGSISVQSTYGKGSTFTVLLPQEKTPDLGSTPPETRHIPRS